MAGCVSSRPAALQHSNLQSQDLAERRLWRNLTVAFGSGALGDDWLLSGRGIQWPLSGDESEKATDTSVPLADAQAFEKRSLNI